MEIKLADFSHKQELLEIWREAFGDGDDFILSFLDGYLFPEYNAPIAVADGKIASVLYLIEFELYASQKVIGTCAYLFAAATREAYRGRGYMSALMKYAAELYKKRDMSAIFLFPQEGSEILFEFYSKFGFKSIYQAKKICVGTNCVRPQNLITASQKQGQMNDTGRTQFVPTKDISGFRLVNHAINNVGVFDELYKSYVEFTAKQTLSPLKDRLFYFKCASSYLDSPDKYFAAFERGTANNVEKFCYVFYKKFENNYYIDDIIMAEYKTHEKNQRNFTEISELLAEFILSSGDNINVEMNVLPEDFEDKDNIKTAMILPLDEKTENMIEKLKSPVYLNMYMNI